MDLVVSEEMTPAENDPVVNNCSNEEIVLLESNIRINVRASCLKATDGKQSHKFAAKAKLVEAPDNCSLRNMKLNALKTSEIEVPYFDMSLSESGGSDHELNKETDDIKPYLVSYTKPNVDLHQAQTLTNNINPDVEIHESRAFKKTFKPLPPSTSGRSRRKAAEAAMIILQTLSDDDDDEIAEEVPLNEFMRKSVKSEFSNEDSMLVNKQFVDHVAHSSEIAVSWARHSESCTTLPVIKLENVDPKSSKILEKGNPEKFPEDGRISDSDSQNVGGEHVLSENSDYLPSDKCQKKVRHKGKFNGRRKIQKKKTDSDSDYRPDEDNCHVHSEPDDVSGSSWDYDYDKDPAYIKSISYEDCVCEICRVHHSNRSMCKLYSSELKTIPNNTGECGEPLFGSSSLPEVLELVSGEDADSRMVIAKKAISKFTIFGPLVGEDILVYAIDPDSDLKSMWVVVDDEDKVTCYSTANENTSNWTRHLTPSRNRRNANVMAISKERMLYFVTISDIETQEPLLVWQDEHMGLALWTKRQHRDLLNTSRCFRTKVIYPTPFHLRMHFMIYHDLRKNGSAMRHKTFCHVCNESLLTSVALTEHCDKLHGQRPWKCGLCHRFLPKPDYRGHLRYCRQNPSRETVLCPLCSRDCLHPQGLRNHMTNMHSGVRQYTCEYCGKQFAMERGLSRHIFGVHHKKQPHVCDQCGKRFSQNANLKVHMLTHSGKKPFQCAEADCATAYTTKQCLQSHYRRAHKYTDDNMPEIIRTVAFTFEDYATRARKVVELDKETISKCRKSTIAKKSSAKQTKAQLQMRKEKSQTLAATSDKSDINKAQLTRKRKVTAKKSTKNTTATVPKRFRKSSTVSPPIGLEAESIPQIIADGEDACFEQGFVVTDASLYSKSFPPISELTTESCVKERCNFQNLTALQNDKKCIESLSSMKKEPNASTLLTDSSVQNLTPYEIKIAESRNVIL